MSVILESTLTIDISVWWIGPSCRHSHGEQIVEKSHQAGSDSLLTWQVFQDLKEVYFGDNDALTVQFAGVVFGFEFSPLSPLKSFNSLNVKIFDATFTVNPLYHQTSAQFDEGAAKGLLSKFFGIYGDCHVLFDSFEIPEKSVPEATRHDGTKSIDICFAKAETDFAGQISPVPAETDFAGQISPEQTFESFSLNMDDNLTIVEPDQWIMMME
ncbi:Condensin complex subunit 2 [Capsicum baccatum]|uniref:Condensin complex subunit 2 n=1 Tax=Capsicum baccatum TaxID=33114 RepID=A0A2G2XS72_CAPBA|nr:Condensin complex subunit 2 [Capsicum baccatum]